MQKISAAFVAAQRKFGPALKSSTNPHFKSKYADLAACVEAVIDALNECGIALMQRNVPSESGVCIETVFVHESGETMSSGPLHVPASKNDPQGYGSALTYARRYSLMAACGIAPEDDDGNAAKAPVKKQTGVKADTLEMSGGVPPERKAWLQELSVRVLEVFDAYGAQAAFETIEAEALEDLDKIQLAIYLGSKAANQIKAYSRSLRTTTKEAA